MNEHHPIEIKLHKKSRLLEIGFDTGENFKLSCEYLRTQSRSAEIKTSAVPVAEKINVNIEKIEPQGSYGLRLFFDDGYDQGIFSWDSLFDLGSHYEAYWAQYLDALDKYGLTRGETQSGHDGPVVIKVLYFMDKLVKVTEKDEEELQLPDSVKTVEDLLKLLQQRGFRWKRLFAEEAIQFTVNKEFAELFTVLEHGDEVALIPKAR